MKKKSLAFIFIFALILGIASVTMFVSGQSEYNDDKKISTDGEAYLHRQVSVPSLNEELENGYPINNNNESYGLTYGDMMEDLPDLELVENEDGIIGYIRVSEIGGSLFTSPNDAANYASEGHYINMYLEDGKTVIGQFWIDAAD